MSRWIQATEPSGEPIMLNLSQFLTMNRVSINEEGMPTEVTRLLACALAATTKQDLPIPFAVLVRETPDELFKKKPVAV